MVDVAVLGTFLAPFLPHLLKLGKSAGEMVAAGAERAIGSKFGDAAWEKAREIWAKLRPGLEAKRRAIAAAEDLAENPEDEEAKTDFIEVLQRILEADPPLKTEVARVMDEGKEEIARVVNEIQNVKANVSGQDNLTQSSAGDRSPIIKKARDVNINS